jgi:hypothetical protein
MGLQVNGGKTVWSGLAQLTDQVRTACGAHNVLLPEKFKIEPVSTFLGAPVGVSAEAELPDLMKFIKDLPIEALCNYPFLQGRLILLRVCLAPSLNFWQRTSAFPLEAVSAASSAIATVLASIMGIDVSDIRPDSWLRATFPVKLGGLGLPDLSSQCPSQFLSSFVAALPRLNTIFPEKVLALVSKLGPTTRSAMTISGVLANLQAFIGKARQLLPKSRNISLPLNFAQLLDFTFSPKLNSEFSALFAAARYKLVFDRSKIPEQALQVSRSCFGAGAWIESNPTVAQHTIPNEEFSAAVCEWIHFDILTDETLVCPCQARSSGNLGNVTILTDAHARNCPMGGGFQVRHAEMIGVACSVLKGLGIPFQLEQPVSQPKPKKKETDGVDRYDISYWLDGKKWHLDFTCNNVAQKLVAAHAAQTALFTANKAIKEKNEDYVFQTKQGEQFLGMALENTGAMSINVLAWLKRLSVHAMGLPPPGASYTAPTFVSFYVQSFSVAVARSNARKVLALRSLAGSG